MRCPICKKNFSKKQFLIEHVANKHKNEIPSSMTVEQYVYYSIHGTIKGKCMCGCGKDTEWNYKTGKPYKLSSDPECKKRIREIALKNGSDGSMLKDIEHQKKMQQNRKIAGVYTFSDGGNVDYLGKNELAFLTFCEKICEFTSRMVLNATQIFTYSDNGVERKYMPDFYLPDYNLLVEIKGDNTNPAYMKDTGYKVKLKDKIMEQQTEYNYIKITDNKFGHFMEMLYDIVFDMKNESKQEKQQYIILESIMSNLNFETHDGLFLILIRDKEAGDVANVAIATDDKLSSIFTITNKHITFLNDIHNIYNDTTSFPDIYKYIGNKDISDRFINLLINGYLNGIDSYTHPIMGLLNMMHDFGITLPIDKKENSDFVQWIM